jgi:hypothetical protein
MQNNLITFARQTIRNHRQTLDDMEQLLNAWPGGTTVTQGGARAGGARGALAAPAARTRSRTRSRSRSRTSGARGMTNLATTTPTPARR